MTSTSSTTTSSSGLSPSIIDYGVGSGLDTQSIIEAELQPYEAPETQLENQQTTLNSEVSDYQQINTDLLALQTQAQSLSTTSGWQSMTATSSNSAVATATAESGTPAGTVQFTVNQLATASSLISSEAVDSTSQVVTTASSILLAQGAGQLGLAGLDPSSNMTVGSHTIDVTQSSQAASTTGTTDLSAETSGIAVDAGSTVNVTVNGSAYSLSLAASPTGGYSGSGLLSAVQSAISSAGASGVLQAGYSSNGQLILSTVDQGSSQSLQVTGGTALPALGLSAMASASDGVDGVIELDGTSTTLSDVQAGAAVTLDGADGSSLGVTLEAATAQSQVNSSILTAGSITATNVSTGSGSLSDVVSNINNAGIGVVASDIQTANNQYVLEFTSSSTGAASDITMSSDAFTNSALGTMNVASQGQDAQIEIGSGSTNYTLESQNDTFSGLLPGLSVTAVSTSTTPVNITVTPDAQAMSTQVSTLVSDANTVLSDVNQYAGYNASTKTGGPLMGSATLQNVTNEVESILTSVTGTSSLGDATNLGITLSNGQFSFDQSTFEAAYSAHPNEVADMFTSGGSFTPAQSSYTDQVSLDYASSTTESGSYDVNISQSASQATSTGTTLASGAVSSGEQLTVASGGASVQYTTSAGQTLSSIASGLNSLFANSSVPLTAELVNDGQQLQLVSDAYGSASSFTVSTTNDGAGTTGLTGSGGTSASFTGTDVEGTIDGITATGAGQYLTAPTGTSPLNGLSLQITTPGITSPTDLGQYTYTPGIAQALSTLGTAMSDPVSGAITQTIKGLQNQSTGLDSQISYYAQVVTQEQTLLTNQYATLDSTMNSLTNQGTALTSELAQIAAND